MSFSSLWGVYLDHLCCHKVSSLSPVKSVQNGFRKKKKPPPLFSQHFPGPGSLRPLCRFSATIGFSPVTRFPVSIPDFSVELRACIFSGLCHRSPDFLKCTSSSVSKASGPASSTAGPLLHSGLQENNRLLTC